MRRPRALTELEGTVLGVVWSRQPCTPYQVRREFTESPSPYWSGSAGAIYPLMTRLEAARLVSAEAHATGSRKSHRYRVTASGRVALRRWIGPPVPDAITGVPPDPLRTRVAFAAVLPAGERLQYLESIEARITATLQGMQQEAAYRGADGPYFQWMARGAVAMQKARLEWVRGVLAALRAGEMSWPSRPPRRA